MAAAKYNLVIEQGTTFNRVITWVDPNGVPINITGAVVKFQFRHKVTDTAPFFSFDSSALTAGQSIGALNSTGVINFTLDDDITATFTFSGAVLWDMLVERPGDIVDRLLEGEVVLRPAVTR